MLSRLFASANNTLEATSDTDTSEINVLMNSLSDISDINDLENSTTEMSFSFDESTIEENHTYINNNKYSLDALKDINGNEISEFSLVCHENAKTPPFYVKVAGDCYHIECCKCSKCNKQITSPSASIISTDPLKLLCNSCSKKIEDETILCPICKQEIRQEDDQEKLLEDYVCHKSCVHCFMCSRTKSDGVDFTVFESSGKRFCLCKDCVNFLTLKKVPSEDLEGRFPKEVAKEKKMKCDSCKTEFPGRFFFFRNGKALCKSCITDKIET